METSKGTTCVWLLFCLCCFTSVRISQGQGSLFVTPPPDLGRPVVANGIVYFLHYIDIPDHCLEPRVSKYPAGAVIRDRRALMRADNPHITYGNLEIAPSGCLYIEPGVEMRFGPGFGIIVNGTLISRGSDEPGGRIVMTKDKGEDTGYPSGDWHFDARLVDGNTTMDGQLNLLYQNKWRGICTNYVNFTEIDANVTCRHLGFLKGNFTYHSFAKNYTDYMLFERPRCTGQENSLFDCPGVTATNIQLGQHICDGQQLIGFECEGLRDGLATDNWRGLEFYNSTSAEKNIEDNVYINSTFSWIEYTDILYAGLDIFHGKGIGVNYQRAAISASPHVPVFNNVTVKYSAYHAFNLTNVEGPIHIANCTLYRNRGYGIYVQTAVGNVLVNMTNITENWGDGIKMYMSNLTYNDFLTRFPMEKSFCRTPILIGQTYPVYIYQDIIDFEGNKLVQGISCSKTYQTLENKKVVIHFLDLIRDKVASGSLEIREQSSTGTLIGTYDITNGSFPQSVTTRTNKAYIAFRFNIPKNHQCESFKPCIRILMRLTTVFVNGTDDDFRLIYSQVSNNTGYGVNIQDMRNKVFFNTSEISDNRYGAGIRVYQGAGEVTVNNTLLERNMAAGINITYSGGFQLINNTKIIGSHGYGIITEYLLLNRTRIESQQKMEIVRSEFKLNEWRAVRVGNYCKGGSILINQSSFAFNFDETIEYLSCNISTTKPTNFSVAFNKFDSNFRHAIFVRPMVNTVGIISNNTFQNHSLGGVLIDNGYDLLISRWYQKFEVDYRIFQNLFTDNYGRYAVSMRLTQNSPFQKMEFKFNKLVENAIQDSFMFLNPRSKANAVVVVSSGNVLVQRNWIQNPNSVREIATHLVDPSVIITGSENWWGVEVLQQQQLEPIHKAIFDQDDRYNLARINYYPVLKTDRLYDNIVSDDVPRFRWHFSRPGNLIGGVLEDSDFTASDHTVYHVDRDIFIIPGRSLVLGRGVVLEFESSVGMVVHGCLRADGHEVSNTVQFRLRDDPDILPVENRTASVRLVDGEDDYEGRLEVDINGEWGTVCNQGWSEQNSLLACQQLGLVYNPDRPTARQKQYGPTNQPILMSWVKCDDVDTDLTQCRAARDGEHQCTHNMDVFLRCEPATWAGITFPATPKDGQACTSQLRHIAIHKAGLLDHATMAHTPALRIDYNYYQMSYITINDALSDAIHIKFNHPHTENKLEYGNITNVNGNGVVLRSSRMTILYTRVTNSDSAGFLFDPFFTEYDSLLVRNSIYATRRTYITENPQLSIGDRGMIFLLTKPGTATESKTYFCELFVTSTFRITLQVLDYSPLTDIEEVTVYDSSRSQIQQNTHSWKIEKDLIDFPVVSSSQYLTIKLEIKGGVRSGRLSFAAISYQYESTPPELKTHLRNCTFSYNYQGIVTKHYNNPSNRKLELYHRHKLETFVFERINVFHSRKEAMYMPSVTKYNEDYVPTWEEMTIPQKVATIEYTIDQCHFLDNEYGILAEHNHVDFANNVWHWTVKRTDIMNVNNGGFEVELPRVNDEGGGVKKHKILFQDNVAKNNKKFAFTVAGYYANVSIRSNTFTNNLCRKGLMTISGMEKDMYIYSNKIESNSGTYMIDLDIISHSEYSNTVSGLMELNEIKGNNYFPGQVAPGSEYSPKTFTVAFRGLQSMKARRNLFENPDLGFELVAATTALSLGNTVDVTENWWGSTNIDVIRKRIFDFDDWNSYAIASYHPYLTRSDVNSDLATGPPVDVPLDLRRLGGRVFNSLSLPYQSTPYTVVADLTVMPQATLTIAPGTVLQFRPNVGILVLGKLQARGLPYNRIKLQPLKDTTLPRVKRDAEHRQKRQVLGDVHLKGDGTLFTDEGFLELYNTSTQSWNIMCDNQFNEKTAEVVCRALGKETINVRVRFTHLYDHYIYGKPSYFRKEFWTFSYYCRGDETSLEQCEKRYNYNLLPCIYAANYTFITCGPRNLESDVDYWGNIRFATDSYQEKFTLDQTFYQDSYVEYMDIEGAGILHGEKVGAIQTTYVTPVFKNINITKCASNGYDIIAPRDMMEIRNQNISGNLGFGVNVLVLNGESSVRESSFTPLGISTIPYHVYGLVDICRMEKEITLDNRMILFYKYSHKAVDCVKIIRSSNPRKTVGLRFLQLNLFHEAFSRNSIELFDGRMDNLLKQILANTSGEDVLRQYTSTGDTLTVLMHASVSFQYYGFIAEIVTVPPTGLTYPDSNYRHVLQQTVIRSNQDGAIQYKNVGEINPSLFIDHCWLEDNGVAILNLTSPPTIDISLQGTVLFDFSHNYIGRNKGGMYFSARTKTIATALRGNISNNVFAYGSHGEALNISGHYYQRVFLFQNYFYNYTAGDYRDVIHIKDVVVNFTYNVITNNVGHYILAAYNNPDPQARQEYTRCGFDDNNATALYESTVKVGRGRPVFHHNYLVNELNDFEFQSSLKEDPSELPVNATQNWWGSDRIGYINGKIWDESDNPLLSPVVFAPPKLDNRSVVDGKCRPGWKLDTGRCYRYMGGALPFYEANEFCRANGGFLADLRGREYFLEYLVRLMRAVNNPRMRVWVMGDVKSGYCAALQGSNMIIEDDCTRLLYPFICEKDPYITQPPEVTDYVTALAIGIGVGIGGLIVLVILIIAILWFIKSRRRGKERFERAMSIRSSIRGSIRSKSQLTVLSTGTSRQRMNDFRDEVSQHSYASRTSRGTSLGNSVESIQSAPRPAVGRTMASLRKQPLHNKGYYPDESMQDDDDDGFDDTFDDDDVDEKDVKVSLENIEGPVYNSGHINHQGQAPRVRNGNLRHVGSQEIAYNYDHGDEEDDDDDDVKSYHKQSLSSFSAPESPSTPVKNTIFLPQSTQSLASQRSDLRSQPLPTPPPTPPVLSRYSNVPGHNSPQQRPSPNLYDDVPSETSSNPRYRNVPGYNPQSPQRMPARSTPDLYDDVPSETSSANRYSNVPGYSPSKHQLQTSARSTPNLYDDVPSESGSDHRYGNVPGYHRPPITRPQPVPRTRTPDIYDYPPGSNTPEFRESPKPFQRGFQDSNRQSPVPAARVKPVPAHRPDRPSPLTVQPSVIEASPSVQPPPQQRFAHPPTYRTVPRDNVLYLQQKLKSPNEESVETEI
ncbi:protein bark beetle-like [Haliotis asinina]|uniref:protein bark beetle-like n=1 Tax=Haliotis asinina TaxID=109174 RepID=UPI003531C011